MSAHANAPRPHNQENTTDKLITPAANYPAVAVAPKNPAHPTAAHKHASGTGTSGETFGYSASDAASAHANAPILSAQVHSKTKNTNHAADRVAA